MCRDDDSEYLIECIECVSMIWYDYDIGVSNWGPLGDRQVMTGAIAKGAISNERNVVE